MIRRPPRSTRTDTLFPYTTLFRSPITGINVISKIVLGGDGNHYLMVYSPDNTTDYDGVRLTLTFSGLNVTVASNLRLNIYHAFALDSTPSCGVSSFADLGQASEIGRASCRERLCQSV